VPVRLIQSLCAVCGSNLAGLTLLYIMLPCVAAVVSRPAWRMLLLLIARYVSNLINEHYYYYVLCGIPTIQYSTRSALARIVQSRGDDFEQISTVKVETRHPVEGSFGSESL